jgi:type IV secretory pathway VirB10-like protein
MKLLFLMAVAGVLAFSLMAMALVYRLTEPLTPSRAVTEAPVVSTSVEPVARVELQWPASAPPQEPIIIQGPAPAVVYSAPAIPLPADPDERAELVEMARQQKNRGPLEQLDARAASRAAIRAQAAARAAAVAQR